MVENQIRNRHRLRKKAIRELNNKLYSTFATNFNLGNAAVDSAIMEQYEIFIIDNEILAWIIDGKPFLTLRGLLRFKPQRRFVTVDMGAVKFVTNGADVMAPGVVDADSEIQVGDLVWVRDENNLQPLVVGSALMSGSEMIVSSTDKAVKSLHYIGDNIWQIKI